MRKNLTISLSQEDWRRVQSMVCSLGETYSGVFHRLIESGAGSSCDGKRIEKYRKLLSPAAPFLELRAGAFARAGRRRRTAA